MLFLKSWLEDYINLSGFSNAELADIITRKSSEVEEIAEIAERFEGKIVVGKIQSLRKHPEADKLNIFDVNVGEKGIIQIVSAATNARDGLIVPVALDGTKLAGITIQAKKLRGFESQGMCCGKSEMLLETKHSSGLWELNSFLEDEAFLGWSICEALPEFFPTEYVLDIKVLPDKIGVIGNHLGMALEIALILEQPELLTPLAQSLVNPSKIISQISKISEEIINPNEPKFQVVFNDEIGYTNSFNLFQFKLNSPYNLDFILQQRMNLIGKNLVNGLVDLSNYLLYDVGQPNHFFSMPKLEENNLNSPTHWNVEKLNSSQSFEGLGQLKTTNLPSDLVVLKQNNDILHIPGISGGESTKTEESETNFLVEIANFKPEEVGRNSFALNYRSDGSKIWAGGVNPARILLGIVRLFSLLEGNISSSNNVLNWVENIGTLPNILALAEHLLSFENNTLNINLEYIVERLDGRGIDFWRDNLISKLGILGELKVNHDQTSLLKLSNFYNRIRTQEDIIAEFVRLSGFNSLQTQYLTLDTSPTIISDFQKKQIWKKNLIIFGFYETITRPFLAKEELLLSIKFGSQDITKDENNSYKAFEILNPYSSLQPYFRDSLLPSLLQSASKNIKRGEKEINLFEASQVYVLKNGVKEEIYEIWGICIGDEITRITSLVHYLNKSLDSKLSHTNLASSWNIIGQGVEYTLTKKSISTNTENEAKIANKIEVLEINKAVKKLFGIPLSKVVWAFRIDFDKDISLLETYPKYIEESDFPAINRNYSLVAPEELLWNNIVEILSVKLPDTSKLHLLPLERIKSDNNSVILNFQANIQSYEKTLEGTEVDLWEKNWQEKLFAEFTGTSIR